MCLTGRHRRATRWTLATLLAVAGGCRDEQPPAVAPDDEAAGTTGGPPALPPVPTIADPFAAEGLDALRSRPRLAWPVESVHVTSYFGWRTDPVSGQGSRMHKGLDLRGRVGDLVLSIGDGTVSFVGHDPLLGNLVGIDHGDGLESLYGHLDAPLAHVGLPIRRGAAVGLVGNSGRSQAPHLHLTVRLDGVAIDPLTVLGEPVHRPRATVAGVEERDPAIDP